MKPRAALLFCILSLLTVGLFVLDMAVGAVRIPPGDIWAALTGGNCPAATAKIVLHIRLLKAVVALTAGAALAVSGLQMQTLFRNPLAGPYVLGISSGASFGVALFMLGAPSWESPEALDSPHSEWPGPHGSARRRSLP